VKWELERVDAAVGRFVEAESSRFGG
jgi:hypothetical protein